MRALYDRKCSTPAKKECAGRPIRRAEQAEARQQVDKSSMPNSALKARSAAVGSAPAGTTFIEAATADGQAKRARLTQPQVRQQEPPRDSKPLGLRYSFVARGVPGQEREVDAIAAAKSPEQVRISVEASQDAYLQILQTLGTAGTRLWWPPQETGKISLKIIAGKRSEIPLPPPAEGGLLSLIVRLSPKPFAPLTVQEVGMLDRFAANLLIESVSPGGAGAQEQATYVVSQDSSPTAQMTVEIPTQSVTAARRSRNDTVASHLPGSLAAETSTFSMLGGLESSSPAFAIEGRRDLPGQMRLTSVLVRKGIRDAECRWRRGECRTRPWLRARRSPVEVRCAETAPPLFLCLAWLQAERITRPSPWLPP